MSTSKYKIGDIVYNQYTFDNKIHKYLVKITNVKNNEYTYEYGFHFCNEGFAHEDSLEPYNGPKLPELWLGL